MFMCIYHPIIFGHLGTTCMHYIGMGQVSSDPRTHKASTLSENDSLGLQNTLAIVYGPM